MLRNLVRTYRFFGSVPSTRIWGFGACNVAQDESEGTSWDLVVSLGKAMKKLVLLGDCPVNGSSEPATRNLSQNPPSRAAANVARGNFRIMRFPMRPTCVMSEEKVSNPLPTLMSKFLTLSCVMCSKLQHSSNLSASRGVFWSGQVA